MSQWLLVRHGLRHATASASASGNASASLSGSVAVAPLEALLRDVTLTRSALWRRCYNTSSVTDRRKRNHFKSNSRDHKPGKNARGAGNASGEGAGTSGGSGGGGGGGGGHSPGKWNLFDKNGSTSHRMTPGNGGKGPRAQQDAGKPGARKPRGFGRRDGASSTVVTTNKFQNLLSFALDDGDTANDKDTASTDGKRGSGRFATQSGARWGKPPPSSTQARHARNPALRTTHGEEDEEDEDENDPFSTDGSNDLALTEMALEGGVEAPNAKPKKVLPRPSTAMKKPAAPSSPAGNKKLLKKQKKKDGRSLLQNFKFENSIFGDEDLFGHVDWEERDTEQRQERRFKRQQRRQEKVQPKVQLPPQEVEIPTRVSVKDLAERMSLKSRVLLRALRDLGEHGLSEDSVLTNDVAEVAVDALNMIPVLLPPEFVDAEWTPLPEDCSAFPVRPSVVSVMGHVDHGKTTLLDALRQSNVAAGEAGGITQSIGAFTVPLGPQFGAMHTMTFLDTPGHAAFSSMRAMGSAVTDLIVLVVAADDGVRPQTREVIALAQANNVPLVVAVTKVDMHHGDTQDTAEVEARLANELLAEGVVVEALGGDTAMVCVSGKTGHGLAALKETLALHAELLDLRADTSVGGEAVVLEGKMARGVGAQVDAIVKWGTLRPGAVVVCGQEYGKIRALLGVDGKRLKLATPGTPVRVVGLKGLPGAGEPLLTVPHEDRAKQVVEQREQMLQWDLLVASEEQRAAEAEADAESFDGEHQHVRKRRFKGASAKSREIELRRRLAEEEATRVASLKAGEHGFVAKVVPIIVKADTAGVLTAIDDLLASLPTDEAAIKRIVGAVGPVTSSDVALAETTGAAIYAFNVRHPASIDHEALQKNVALRHHTVIYSLLDDITELLTDHLDGVQETEVLGAAEVLQAIPITTSGRRTVHVAGCRVTLGAMPLQAKYRLLRDGELVAEDVTMESMRHFQDKVSEVTKGQECGLQFQDGVAFQPGDLLEAYVVKTVKKVVTATL